MEMRCLYRFWKMYIFMEIDKNIDCLIWAIVDLKERYHVLQRLGNWPEIFILLEMLSYFKPNSAVVICLFDTCKVKDNSKVALTLSYISQTLKKIILETEKLDC